ncbi:MAG: F0F1 ATP synthase subunit A [Aestuariivirga sp.]
MTVEQIRPYAIRQFEIDVLVPLSLFGHDVSFTISSQAMLTTVIVVSTYLIWATRELTLVPGRLQASAEMVYTFVEDTITRFGGPEAKQTLPFFLTMFVFLLFGSLIGLTPIKFTFTSHLIVTLGLAVAVFVYVNYLGFKMRGLGFFHVLLPQGTPLYLAPLIIVIELISFFFRPVTLGMRIFANIFAGHVMLKLFGDFCAMLTENLGGIGLIASVLPLSAMVLMYFVEAGVMMIQSYIFIVLSSIYVKDAFHSH